MAHERLIADMFEDPGERQIARAWVDQCTRGWREDQVIAVLHEFGQPTEMTGEQSLAYMLDFPRQIGVPEYQVSPSVAWFDAGAPGGIPDPDPPPAEAAEPPSEDDDVEIIDVAALVERSRTPPPPPVPPVPDRMAAAQADVARFEEMLRSDPGAYWGSPSNQSSYHAALTTLHGGENTT